jgi:cation:H+ antiporter
MLASLPDALWVDVVLVLLSIAVLWKAADWFVEGAVGIAERLKVPTMLVGLVLVSIATTAPELMASLMSALRGIPEVALGNAMGSVMVDASVALGLGALLSARPLKANRKIFHTSALFLLASLALIIVFCIDGTLGRAEGLLLVFCYITYAATSYLRAKRGHLADEASEGDPLAELAEVEAEVLGLPTSKILTLFFAGLVGVLIGSHMLLDGAEGIAIHFKLPAVVIGLTVVAIGTSVPEIATVAASALKGHSGVGIGNVIGADILNICWVAGVSATANPLAAQTGVRMIMFPAATIVVVTMLLMLRKNYELNRLNGGILLSLYLIYMVTLLTLAPEGTVEKVVAH